MKIIKYTVNAILYFLASIGAFVLANIIFHDPVDDIYKDIINRDLHSISIGLKLYYLDSKRFPSAVEGLNLLVSEKTRSNEPYIYKLPQNPWGDHYQYMAQGYGPDRVPIIWTPAPIGEGIFIGKFVNPH